MPQLSAWRVRRNAWLREKKRVEALELQKLRKTATRRCRNCLTPYRDQNPGGGKFMCSYCGHISKRPVLDLPVPPGMDISNSGIIKDLVGKGGKILNGKGWSDNGWVCGQDWLGNGNWAGGSVAGKSNYWGKNGSGIFGGDENCSAEKSYSSGVVFACKLLTSFFLSIRWLWRKIFGISSSRDDGSSDSEHGGLLAKRGENGTNFHESRVEKARRKAEEKRQARLERELLEEEERKQREEVARLVEERRRLRDEKIVTEKDRGKSSPSTREKESKKESEKTRQDKRKEKDKASSKSNSDAEELERRAGKEADRKRSEIERRDYPKSGADNVKSHVAEAGHGFSVKNASASNLGRGNAGTRYLDRMKGTFLSSSKAFSGGSFFGRGTANTPTMKENKINSSIDYVHTSADRRDSYPPERVAGKLSMNGEDKHPNRPVILEPQARTTPKKSWQQLFTRPSSIPPSSNTNVISRPNSKLQSEVQSPQLGSQSSPIQTFDNPINFGLPSPFLPSYTNGAPSSSLGFSPAIEPMFSRAVERTQEFIPDEQELFEDPSYVPDPVSLLGPVSESLDNFQLDVGPGFVTEMGFEKPRTLKNVCSSAEVSKPSPIESPSSRLRVADEKLNGGCHRFQHTTKAQGVHTFPVDDASANDIGTWQMWNSTPLYQDGLGLGGGASSWLLPHEHNRSNKEEFLHSSNQKTMASLFSKDDPVLAHSPRKFYPGNGQCGGTFSPVSGLTDQDPWLKNAFFPPMSGGENFFSLEPQKKGEVMHGISGGSPASHSLEPSPTKSWSKNQWGAIPPGSGEGTGKTFVGGRPHVGGLFPNPDVQSSLWSFD